MNRIRAVAIILHKGKVLLMHRINYGKEYYVFPGGGVEGGETVKQAVLREVREETTLEVELRRLLYHHILDDNSEQFFYLCDHISGEPKLGEGNEMMAMKENAGDFYEPIWMSVGQLSRLLVYPLEIRDWLILDIKNNFAGGPREEYIKVSNLRHTLP